MSCKFLRLRAHHCCSCGRTLCHEHSSYHMDVLVVCSSAGWTDQKHMVYISLLEESFVSQLHDGDTSFKGLFNLSPRASRPKQSSNRGVKNIEACQGYLGVVEVDRAKSWIKVEQIRSPCCENEEDGKVHYMDDDASTTEQIQEASSQASATSSVQSSTCHFGKHRHSPYRSSEGSDQNFIDEETKGIRESRRLRSTKRLKSAGDMLDDQVVPSMKAEIQQMICLNARKKDKDDRDGSSEVDVGLLNAEPGSSCKSHGPKG